ncbi:MAG: periplasmic heavy metal sensor [Deltaproteobacteria bacterium]|nr:periplasmic heavy metal sensor [Deltaproteobacteria bacterium]
MRTAIALAGLWAVLAGSGAIRAAEPDEDLGTPAAPAALKRFMHGLGLDARQIDRIEALHFQADRERIDIRHALQTARLDLAQALRADRPDRRVVFELLDRIGELEIRLRKNRIGLVLDIRALMTAEQWERLEIYQSQRLKRETDADRDRTGP